MSLRQPRDGRPTGVKGHISAQAMKDALGIGAKPVEVPVADSPAQARLRSEGRDGEADALASDDFSAGVLGPSEVYEAWGSPTLTDPTVPDGHPQPIPPPKSEAARQARRRSEDVSVVNGPSPEESADDDDDAAEQLRGMAQEHVRRQYERTKWAQENGSPAQKARAAVDAQETATLVSRIRDKLGGSS